jgi:hypothetical protein
MARWYSPIMRLLGVMGEANSNMLKAEFEDGLKENLI